MDRRNRTAGNARKSRRRMTLLWSVLCAGVVITLMMLEQIAVLYVLATLGVAVLLIIVALSNLKGARTPGASQPTFDDAAAISDGITSPSTTFGAAQRGGVKNR